MLTMVEVMMMPEIHSSDAVLAVDIIRKQILIKITVAIYNLSKESLLGVVYN